MKKAFLLLVLLVMLCGCAGGIPKMAANESLDSSFAYVTGKAEWIGQWIYFEHEGETDQTNMICLTRDNDYPVFKVRPGRYILTSVGSGGNTYTGSMGVFTAQAGKITYVGDLIVHFRYLSTGLNVTTFETFVEVQNNSNAAKDAIGKNYPGLADKLNSSFIYQPVRQ